MATSKKATAKKVATKKVVKKAEPTTAAESKEFRIEQLPLDALKGIINSAEQATVEVTKEKVTEMLLDFSPVQQKEIIEDVQRNLRRDVDDRITDLKRQAENLQRQTLY
jgi:hypothetical protein